MLYHLLDEREVFSEGNGGAISRWVANVMRGGDEVVICVSADDSWGYPPERIYQWSSWSTVAHIHALLYRLPFVFQKLLLKPLFRKLLRKLAPGDMIYVHNRPAYAAVLSTLASEGGIKVGLHMHNSLMLQANQGQRRALRDTLIVVLCEFMKREIEDTFPGEFNHIYVVNNGADGTKYRCEQKRKNNVPTVVFSGRLVPHKGVHILLEAMRVLDARGIKAKCRIAGAARFGSNKPSTYVKKLQRLKPANTELSGYKVGDELADMLRDADVFCCPSTWQEPFALAALEAMATGLPVVATDGGGFPEMFFYGGGVLVRRNDAEDLANALERIIVDRKYREELGRQAWKAFNEHFMWSIVRGNHLRVVNAFLC
jgi:spore coat protein SA